MIQNHAKGMFPTRITRSLRLTAIVFRIDIEESLRVSAVGQSEQ
jgi:hypothetical protein